VCGLIPSGKIAAKQKTGFYDLFREVIVFRNRNCGNRFTADCRILTSSAVFNCIQQFVVKHVFRQKYRQINKKFTKTTKCLANLLNFLLGLLYN